MRIIKWLNDNGVLISKKLAEVMAEFEFHNSVDINKESVQNFIQEVVQLTKQVLSNSDNLAKNTSAVQIIHEIILQLEPHSLLKMAITGMLFEITGKVVDFQIGDVTDRLMIEIIRCTVQSSLYPSSDFPMFAPEPNEEITR